MIWNLACKSGIDVGLWKYIGFWCGPAQLCCGGGAQGIGTPCIITQTHTDRHIQGVPIPCAPPPQHNWAGPYPKPIYFHDPTSIPDLHARFQITNLIYLLLVTWFMMRGRAHFCEQILPNFLGCFNQNGYNIVNNWRRPYMIHHLKANVFRHAVKL